MEPGLPWMVRRDDGVMVVHARGELGFLAAAGLREIVLDAVEHPGPSGVALDLSAVTFIDSVSLAALVSGFKAAHAAGLPLPWPPPARPRHACCR